jgi:hypothetical protein
VSFPSGLSWWPGFWRGCPCCARDFLLDALVCMRAMIEVVGNDLGSSWGWGGWPLLYG